MADYLWRHVAFDAGVRKDAIPAANRYLPATIGVVERFLYVAALLSSLPDFIGVWLALKVAGGWQGWSGTHLGVPGRSVFNTSLLTSAISLVWAISGAAIVSWAQQDRVGYAVAAAAGVFAATYGSWLVLKIWWDRRSSAA